MTYQASITSQGQLTIPKGIRSKLGINGQTTATITLVKGKMVVQTEPDFWSLGGSLHSPVSLTDQELRDARDAFSGQWADPA